MADLITFSPLESIVRIKVGGARWDIGQDGGVVESLVLNLGFERRGIEGILRVLPFSQVSNYADRVDYRCAPAYNLAVCVAAERLLDIEIPARAITVRTVLLELSRIYNHLAYLSGVAHASLDESYRFYFIRERDKISDLLEMYCGSRLGFGAICLGGVPRDVNAGLFFQIERTLRSVLELVSEYWRHITIGTFYSNTLNLLTIDDARCEKFGFSGPNEAASNLERIWPGSLSVGSTKITFGKPAGLGGVFARVAIRVEELFSSTSKILELIQGVEEGNYRIRVGSEVHCPKGRSAASIAGPKGDIGVFLVSNGEREIEEIRFFTPSSRVATALPELMVGIHLDDFPLALHSLDLSISEVEK